LHEGKGKGEGECQGGTLRGVSAGGAKSLEKKKGSIKGSRDKQQTQEGNIRTWE